MSDAAGRTRRARRSSPSRRTAPSPTALVAGLIGALRRAARWTWRAGRILLPNNRAVRTVTEAFVRASGGGLLLPRLVPIGDPELDERIGGALDPADAAEPIPPAVEPLARLLALAELVAATASGAAEAMRLAADLARTLDALLVEEVDAGAARRRGRRCARTAAPLAAVARPAAGDPRALAGRARATRARSTSPSAATGCSRGWPSAGAARRPTGFTVAAGNHHRGAGCRRAARAGRRLPDGMVVLPGLSLADGDARRGMGRARARRRAGRGEETHPQYPSEAAARPDGRGARRSAAVALAAGRSAAPAARGRADRQCDDRRRLQRQMERRCKPAERRLTGIRAAELPDPAAEAQAIALALREALETPGRTAALVTPDRMLAARVSALSRAGASRPTTAPASRCRRPPPGTLLLGIAAAAAEDLAPVPLLALLKHPLVGGEGDERLAWLDAVRALDLALRGPRPAAGLAGLDAHFAARSRRAGSGSGAAGRRRSTALLGAARAARRASPSSLARCGRRRLPATRAWRGPDGRMAAELIAELQARPRRPRCRCRRRGRGPAAAPVARRAARSGRPMAGIRGCSSGACSRRGCSRPI